MRRHQRARGRWGQAYGVTTILCYSHAQWQRHHSLCAASQVVSKGSQWSRVQAGAPTHLYMQYTINAAVLATLARDVQLRNQLHQSVVTACGWVGGGVAWMGGCMGWGAWQGQGMGAGEHRAQRGALRARVDALGATSHCYNVLPHHMSKLPLTSNTMQTRN